MKILILLTVLISAPLYAQSKKIYKIRNQYASLFDFKQLKNIKLKKEVKIAIIDTGIDIKNRDLSSRIWLPSFLKNKKGAYGWDCVNQTPYPKDHHGHGSHVAGIIVSIFPKAKIFPINYYSTKYQSNDQAEKAFTEAIRLAVKAQVDIINLSGGGITPVKEELEILKEAEAQGIIIIAAAGNERSELDAGYPKKGYYPAGYNLSNIISVMNHDKEDKVSSSNYGKNVTISAPGYKIQSFDYDGALTTMTGTSQSTPVITALTAYLKALYPEMTPQELKLFIKLGTKKLSNFISYNKNGGVIRGTKALYALSEYLKYKKGEFGPSVDKLESELNSILAEKKNLYKKLVIASILEETVLADKLETQDLEYSLKINKVKDKLRYFIPNTNSSDITKFEDYFKKRSIANE